MISGHDHIPRTETLSGKTYINLGTFFHHQTVARYNKDGLKLVTWDASTETFSPVDGKLK
jgi:UDP-2,3-diacylglucosamine pyrophosphatase LpxH